MIFLKIIAWWFGVTIFLFAALCAKALWAERRDLQAAGKEHERRKRVVQLNSSDPALGASVELNCGAPNLQQIPHTLAETAQPAASRSIM